MPTENRKLAFTEGEPAPESTGRSLWTALHDRASVDPDRLALLSPKQPANLLAELVQPLPQEITKDGRSYLSILGGQFTQAGKFLTSPSCMLSYALSWLLPAPAVDGDYLRWSFAELRRATIRVASLLRQRGINPGATTFFFTPVSAEWSLLLSVSVLNRYSAVTLRNSALAHGNKQALQKQINLLRPSLIVVSTEAEARFLAHSIDANITLGISLEDFKTSAPAGWMSMSDIAKEAATHISSGLDTSDMLLDHKDDDPTRTALIIYTSGSSGNSKGCPVSVRQLLSALGHLSKLPLSLLPAPLALVSGVSSQSRCQALTIMSWATGNAAVVDASNSSAESILAALETCRPVTLSLLVTAVKSMAHATNYSTNAIKSVRYVHLIGSTITMATLRAAQKTFPRARILTSFAMTEATATTTWTKDGRPSVNKMPSWHGIASSGRVAHGAALKIVSADGTVAKRGEVGALHLSGDSVIGGYVDSNSEAQAAFYTADDGCRWFVSGDDAVIDAEGLLYVLGRSEYTIRRDGEVIVPCTIEDSLEMHFQHSTVVVVNFTTKIGDAGLFAIFQEAIPTPCQTDIQAAVVQNLGSVYRIEGAASLREVGFLDWPLTPGGKIAYRDLRSAIETCFVAQ